MKSKIYLVMTLAAAVFFAACGRTEGVRAVNTNDAGLAVKGFDTVAYFSAEKAIEGNPQFAFVWNGAKWYFSSVENLEKFKAAPERFAPQFGGYCSYAVSHGYTADADPQAWKIVDGRLYLNYNQQVREMWEREEPKLIEEGAKNWTEFQKKKPEHKE
jgi:YHS domain-containing protein